MEKIDAILNAMKFKRGDIPDTWNGVFEGIPLENVPVGDFRVVAEFVEVVKN